MQMIIGNCINAEDWLSFSALPAFTHTMVDRNYCSSHSVVSSPGSYAFLPGQVIETHSKNNTDGMNWTFTAHSFKPYPYLPPQPMPEGYAAGDRALNTMAYVCTTNVAVFRRTDIKRWISADGEYQQSVYIEAGFDKPFGPVNAPTPCHMSVKIQASVEGTTIQPESGEEVFSFSCTYGPVADSPWMRVSADGFGDNIYSGAWMDLLTQMGIWKKYSSPLSSLFYDQFYPLLYVAPDDANVIFDNRSTAWYQEMLDGPPDTVF